VLDLETDEMEWYDDLEAEDEEEATTLAAQLIHEAGLFYQREVERYEKM
jgi:hypothetical protein